MVRGAKSTQLFVRDVTKRVEAEMELNTARELNESLTKSLPDYIYFKDINGRFLKVNNAAARAFGEKKPEDVVGKSDSYYFGKEHFEKSIKEEQEIMESKKSIIGEMRREYWPNKSVQWVSFTKMPLFGPGKEVIGTFGVSRDMTMQKQAETELLIREQRFRHFFQKVNVGLAIVNKKYRIREVNDALSSILLCRPEDLVGKKIVSFIDRRVRDDIKQYLLKSIEQGLQDDSYVECKMKKQNGQFVHVFFQLVMLEEIGNMKDHYMCQVIDMNDRKIAEKQLLIRNEELNNFVYKVSHDLRAPLLSVKGLINLMKIEENPDHFSEYISMIDERVNNLDDFIRDILSHSKNLNTQVRVEEIIFLI